MKRRIAALLACLMALTYLYGCDNILEDDMLDITAHQEPVSTISESIPEAGTYAELKANMLGFVSAYEDSGQIRIYSYDGDIQTDVDLACSQIMADTPLGAYAVSDITGIATPIVSYHQVEISITYKVTKEQLDSIIPVSTIRFLQSDLEDMLSDYAPSMVVQPKGITLTEEDAMRYVKEIYYDNPMDIVMMPVTTVDPFPKQGPDRIFVFTFGYTKYEATTLKAMEASLKKAVQNIAESVSGDNDAAILLSFCQRLIETVDFDSFTAASGEYGDQNTAATAYGALKNRSAVAEGYAMAFKALCDELGLECYVMLGEYNGKPHAWNIVELENHYYHIDVSMCDTGGIATSFLLDDAEMAVSYTWDKTRFLCDGPLTYADVAAETSALVSDSAGESAVSADASAVLPDS